MKDIIEKLENRIQVERTPIDREARFDAMLDEIYSFDEAEPASEGEREVIAAIAEAEGRA